MHGNNFVHKGILRVLCLCLSVLCYGLFSCTINQVLCLASLFFRCFFTSLFIVVCLFPCHSLLLWGPYFRWLTCTFIFSCGWVISVTRTKGLLCKIRFRQVNVREDKIGYDVIRRDRKRKRYTERHVFEPPPTRTQFT